MVKRTMKPYRHVVDVGKDCLLGTFTENERWWEGDFLAEPERRVILAKNAEYPMQ